MNRRDFMINAGAMAVIGGLAPACTQAPPAPASSRTLGIQLWTLARQLAEDFEGTIAMLAELGYRELETFGPYTFSDPRQIEYWNSVTPQLGFSASGFFGHGVDSIRDIFASHSMRVPSLHTDLFTLQTRMGELAEAAHALGASYVTLPALPEEQRQTFDDYRRAADLFNAIGEDAASHGTRFAYHNHGYGLVPVEQGVPLDTLLSATDPELVFLEMDIYWTIAGGADPKDYLARYPGRYKMMHVKDMQGEHVFAGDGGDATQWIELFQYMVPLGDGSVDIAGIVDAAETAGVEHFFVEQDRADDVSVAVARSADYLKSIGFS